MFSDSRQLHQMSHSSLAPPSTPKALSAFELKGSLSDLPHPLTTVDHPLLMEEESENSLTVGCFLSEEDLAR
jgi:hypothetical protein